MYSVIDYFKRGGIFLNNQVRPGRKKLASLMIYATDLCDSACKHCLIWTKRPTQYLPEEKIFKLVKSSCVGAYTKIGLEGGEFLLHPQAEGIMHWFKNNHPNFDLLSNCLQPDKLIDAVKKNKPQRLWVSLDGDQATYQSMRGKDGYHKVLHVLQSLQQELPISLMFTLSPYNDFGDLEHVAGVAKRYGVDLRVGIYNNIDFFETFDAAHSTAVGAAKEQPAWNLKKVRQARSMLQSPDEKNHASVDFEQWKASIFEGIKAFDENYDFILLYNLWQNRQVKLRCFSIFDNVIVLPNGDVPICQNLPTKLGNIYSATLDQIINSQATIQTQKHHSKNCNACWINYHRKQDIVLYRTLEKTFGKQAVSKVLGYYQWNDHQQSYRQITG